jgi:hypothetical protein
MINIHKFASEGTVAVTYHLFHTIYLGLQSNLFLSFFLWNMFRQFKAITTYLHFAKTVTAVP